MTSSHPNNAKRSLQRTAVMACVAVVSLCNIAVFLKTLLGVMQMRAQGISDSDAAGINDAPDDFIAAEKPPHPEDGGNRRRSGGGDDTCLQDITRILQGGGDGGDDGQCLVDADEDWRAADLRRGHLRKLMEPSFWSEEKVARCWTDDYELAFVVVGPHVIVFALPHAHKSNDLTCPIVATDAAPLAEGGVLEKHITLVEDGLTQEEKENSVYFGNHMTMKDYHVAVENARTQHVETVRYDFVTDNCATFALDVAVGLGIDYKERHRKEVTDLVVRGLMKYELKKNNLIALIREKLRWKIGGTIWANLKSEQSIFEHFVSLYIDRHSANGA